MLRQYLTRPDGSLPPGVDRAALEAAGILIVQPRPRPRDTETLVYREASAQLQHGVWRQRWVAHARPASPAPVPETVTPLQARRALRAAGLLATVEALMASAPEEAREAWEYAVEIRRDDATLAALAAQIGLTAPQLDDLFRDAAAR
jgi:hypothetical protein